MLSSRVWFRRPKSSMITCVFSPGLSSPSDTSLHGAITLLFTMMDKRVKCVDINPTENCDGDLSQSYQDPMAAPIVLA